MKKELLVQYPSITCWSWQANLLSILEAHPETYPWIFSHYIQLFCKPDFRLPGHIFLDFSFPARAPYLACPYIHTQYLDRAFIGDICNAKTLITTAIHHGYYIYAIMNQQHFVAGRTDHFLHETFVYGYDIEQNSCNIADFTMSGTGKYTYETVQLDAVCKGLEDVKPEEDYLLQGLGGIILLRFDASADYALEQPKIRQQLLDYLQGVNSYPGLKHRIQRDNEERVYGRAVYNLLHGHIDCCTERKERLDVRAYHNLYEHKKLMEMRLDFLGGEGKIVFPDSLLSEYKSIVQDANKLWSLAVKYNLTMGHSPAEKAAAKLHSLLGEIEERECNVYTQLAEHYL